MKALHLHPDCPAGAVHQITAAVVATKDGCSARFAASGDMDEAVFPELTNSERTDNLWKTTCFEIFWEREDGSYREFNLSPSTRWACYDFDSFREGMRDAPADVKIGFEATAGGMELVAHITSDLPVPAKVALNAIIEEADGALRFWALEFAPGKPEFHSEVCRALTVEQTS
ncbi:hypothetical protein [Altererythrobacter aquiaggeris]|uniref:hypothetical protein n=1 Tax=Aestuarierythrobacter aquiaggeris TaxID=1898396 RepID=UPI00301A11D7